MSLINCPECETEQSEHASTCQKCGFPIRYHFNTPDKKYKAPDYDDNFQLSNKQDGFFDADAYFYYTRSLNEDVLSEAKSTTITVYKNGIELDGLKLKLSYAQIVDISEKHIDDSVITLSNPQASYRQLANVRDLSESEVKSRYGQTTHPQNILEITFYENGTFRQLRLLFYRERHTEQKLLRLKNNYENTESSKSDERDERDGNSKITDTAEVQESSSDKHRENAHWSVIYADDLKKFLTLSTESIESIWIKRVSKDTGELWLILVMFLPILFFWIPFFKNWKLPFKIIVPIYALIFYSAITPDKNYPPVAQQSDTSAKSFGPLSIAKLCEVMTSKSYGRPLETINARAVGVGKYKVEWTRASDQSEWVILCWKEGSNQLLWRTIDKETGKYGRVRNSEYDERIYFHDKGEKVIVEFIYPDGSSSSETIKRSDLRVY